MYVCACVSWAVADKDVQGQMDLVCSQLKKKSARDVLQDSQVAVSEPWPKPAAQ